MYLSQINASELSGEKIDAILFSQQYEQVEKSDYAIVLGTDPKYAAIRAEIAASFYRKGGTQKLIVSGAAVADKSITESAFLQQELAKRGVPGEAIIEETRANDTIQNMIYSLAEISKREDITTVGSITIITEPFHMRRSLCLANAFLPRFIKVYGYTEGVPCQRAQWKTDERLNRCVHNEIAILCPLIASGRIEDIVL
ncbi:MAG: YdcF family protein [Clostridia bacterium]|nr:YdcF family protein [Clostridia bacterium]